MLLRDIRARSADVIAVLAARVDLPPDILVLLDIDHDRDALAPRALASSLAEGGVDLPHVFAPRPTAGRPTDLDIDGDGRRGGPGDSLGWGRFSGSGGMVLLSRWPIRREAGIDHGARLWADAPGSRLPPDTPQALAAILPLASTGQWEVPVLTPDGPLVVMAWHAAPPAFSPLNPLRNADQNAFWRLRLNEALGSVPAAFVLAGNANLDPERGAGERAEIAALLAHPALQDPIPRAPHPVTGALDTATAWWPNGPGALRVSYLLPAADLVVRDAGLRWTSPATTHALLWVDLAFPR